MNPNVLYAALPDLSARIMQQTLSNELNINWDTFCRDNHLKPLKLDLEARELLAQDEFLLQQGFATLTANHPDLWCKVGMRYRSIKYGPLGLAMMTSRTLAEALETVSRLQSLTYSIVDYRYVSAPNGSGALIADDSGLPAHLHDFTYHRDLGAIKTLIADLVPDEQVIEKVTVAAPPPSNWNEIKSQFPFRVEFDAERTQWIFLPGSGSRLLPLGDSELQDLYSSRCGQMLKKAVAETPLKQRVATLLGTRRDEMLNASDVARQLALSERTLHRRLAEEGARFSTIVDEACYGRARTLLADRRMSIEAIATAVGFAEPSSFSRAFRRWAGVSALEYRRQLLQ